MHANSIKQLYFDFWTAFTKYAKAQGSTLPFTNPIYDRWLKVYLESKRAFIELRVVHGKQHAVVELRLADEDSDAIFDYLMTIKNQIEKSIGTSLEWNRKPRSIVCTISKTKEDVDLGNKNAWNNTFSWILNMAEQFYVTFVNKIHISSNSKNKTAEIEKKVDDSQVSIINNTQKPSEEQTQFFSLKELFPFHRIGSGGQKMTYKLYEVYGKKSFSIREAELTLKSHKLLRNDPLINHLLFLIGKKVLRKTSDGKYVFVV